MTKNNSFLKYTVLSVALLLGACAGSEQQGSPAEETASAPENTKASLRDFSWLAGSWQHNMGEGIAFEEWHIAAEGMLQGRGGFIKGTDTMISETLSIEQSGDDILYIPIVAEQNDGKPVPFRLTSYTSDTFVFENPQHDFPTKITYVRKSAEMLVATISGVVNGEEQKEVYELTKVQ